MNAKTVTLAIALSLASAASLAANPAWPSTESTYTPSTVSREQVRAELAQAQAAGRADAIRIAYDLPEASASDKSDHLSRSQVRAEIERARARGELDTAFLAYGAAPVAHGSASHAMAATATAANGSF